MLSKLPIQFFRYILSDKFSIYRFGSSLSCLLLFCLSISLPVYCFGDELSINKININQSNAKNTSTLDPSTSNPSTQIGQKTYYDDQKKGWYWYENPPEKPKEKKAEQKPEPKTEPKPKQEQTSELKTIVRKLPSLKDYTTEQLWNMHPDDFQKVLDEFHKKAVMKPSEENMYEYLVVYDIARRKALAVANVQVAMMQKHPEFNVGSDYPIAAPGRGAYTRATSKEITNKISNGRGDFGLIFFYADNCEYCIEQENILKYFIDKYNWETKKIEINSNPRIASRFNVTTVPYLMLIYKKSEDYFPVSVGVISLNDMEERIYRGMRLLTGETTMEDYSIYDFQKGGTFDTKKYK